MYIKQYEKQTINGLEQLILTNPITKENPWRNEGDNRATRRTTNTLLLNNRGNYSLGVHSMLLPDAEGNLSVKIGKYHNRKQFTNKLVRKITKNGSIIIKKYGGKLILHQDLLTKPPKAQAQTPTED